MLEFLCQWVLLAYFTYSIWRGVGEAIAESRSTSVRDRILDVVVAQIVVAGIIGLLYGAGAMDSLVPQPLIDWFTDGRF